ncbi:DUF2064 domain-containing protein [Ferruginibacter sp.]
MQQNTVILIFSRSAKSESICKKLHTDHKKNIQLHQALYNKTISITKETKLPFIIIDELQQQGSNFGEKFCNAAEYCFDKGYTNLITIGSDCATLSATDILTANSQLQNNTNVIGADNRGGFYLLALQKKYYQRGIFLNLNWCSSQLFKNITAHFKDNLNASFHILQYKQDINNAGNLNALRKQALPDNFIKLLSLLSISIYNRFYSTTLLLQQFFYNSPALRGPPTFSIL